MRFEDGDERRGIRAMSNAINHESVFAAATAEVAGKTGKSLVKALCRAKTTVGIVALAHWLAVDPHALNGYLDRAELESHTIEWLRNKAEQAVNRDAARKSIASTV